MRSVYSINEFRYAYQLSFEDAWRLFSCHGPDRLALDLAMVVEESSSAEPTTAEARDQVVLVSGSVVRYPGRAAAGEQRAH